MARQSAESLATLREQVTSKGARPPRHSRFSMPPAFVLSSLMRWRSRPPLSRTRRRVRRPLNKGNLSRGRPTRLKVARSAQQNWREAPTQLWTQ